MPASISDLFPVHSRLADDIIAFCDAVIERLDTTNFSFKGPDGTSGPVAISTTGIDSRVFTLQRLPEPRDDVPGGSGGRKSDGNATPNAHDKAIADLNETPGLADQLKTKPWSRAFADARPGRPLVIRGAPGGGKTTLSRHSTIQRLKAVRDALFDHTLLAQDTSPMLWTTCTALAECPYATDPADLIINAAFHALPLSEDHRARSVGVREWLRARIKAGKCPVAVDSLDEVKVEHRTAFEARAPRLPDLRSPVILTCRVVEWDQRRPWTGWGANVEGPYEIAPLNEREQRTYTERFFREGITQPDKLQGIRSALAANLPLRRTCESPILLFFACLLHAEGELAGAVRRTDLYQQIRRRLFLGEWKGLPSPPTWADGKIREARVTAWLSEIALALFRAAPEAKTFALSEWDNAVASPGATAAQACVTPPLAADALFSDLEQCGLLVSAGRGNPRHEPHYSFPHRSFLAFLAGHALAGRTREEWMEEVIANLWFKPAWEDVILFLAGHLNESEADALLEEIEKEPEDIFRQRLHWQWRIAGEVTSLSAKWGERWVEPAVRMGLEDRTFEDKPFCPSSTALNGLLKTLGVAVCVAPQPLEALLQRLNPSHEQADHLRLRAAEVLGMMGNESAVDSLAQCLVPGSETDSEVRHGVAQALGNIGGERALNVLLTHIDHTQEADWLVRSAVAEALGQIGGERAQQALLAHLDPHQEPDSECVRSSIAEALGRIGGDSVLRELLIRFQPSRETDRWVRAALADALGEIGGESALPALLPSLDRKRESDHLVRQSVVRALALIGGNRALEALIPFMDSEREPESYGRRGVAMALGQIGGESTLNVLLPLLDSKREPDATVREGVAFALGIIGGGRALSALIPRMAPKREPSNSVRSRVAGALGRIGGQQALNALMPHLDQEYELAWTVRMEVALAMGAVGGSHAQEWLLPYLDPTWDTTLDDLAKHNFKSKVGESLWMIYNGASDRTPFLL